MRDPCVALKHVFSPHLPTPIIKVPLSTYIKPARKIPGPDKFYRSRAALFQKVMGGGGRRSTFRNHDLDTIRSRIGTLRPSRTAIILHSDQGRPAPYYAAAAAAVGVAVAAAVVAKPKSLRSPRQLLIRNYHFTRAGFFLPALRSSLRAQ